MLPAFETERLILREVTLDDSDSYEKNFADYDVIKNLSAGVPWPFPKGGTKEFLKSSILPNLGIDRWLWVILLKNNPNEVIGAVDLWREGTPEHRGFWLGKKYWGNGYMTEAVAPIMDYAFEDLGFEKLIFANAVGNIKSRRIKEKTGSTLLKVEPCSFVNPEFTEHEIWELTKENWKLHRS